MAAAEVIVRPLAEQEVSRLVAAGLGLARLARPGAFYLVAWEGDAPLGHAFLALDDGPELQDVEVLPQHRLRGVATALARAAEREARRRGHNALRLTVSETNAAAHATYGRLGYVDVGIPPRRVVGTVQIRTGPLEVDDTLLTWEKRLLPPALLLHGGPGLTDYTGPLQDELAPLFDVSRYQQGGHVAIDDYVAEATAQLQEPSWLVGHSWGGRLALHVAAARPELVGGLVLVGTLGAVGDGGLAEAGATLIRRLGRPAGSFRELWDAYFAGEPAPFPEHLRFDAEQYAASVAAMSAAAATLAAALPSLDVPALFLHGSHDHIPLGAVEATAALLPHAEVRVLDGVGHFPWLEQPGLLRRELAGFAAGAAGSPQTRQSGHG